MPARGPANTFSRNDSAGPSTHDDTTGVGVTHSSNEAPGDDESQQPISYQELRHIPRNPDMLRVAHRATTISPESAQERAPVIVTQLSPLRSLSTQTGRNRPHL
jgi:hypothetical protein